MDPLPSGHLREDLSHKESTGLEERGQGQAEERVRGPGCMAELRLFGPPWFPARGLGLQEKLLMGGGLSDGPVAVEVQRHWNHFRPTAFPDNTPCHMASPSLGSELCGLWPRTLALSCGPVLSLTRLPVRNCCLSLGS